jgi:hypothetical protein
VNDTYKIKAVWDWHGSIADFVKTIQKELYDEGGVAGMFEVLEQNGNEITVEFRRSLDDDEELALSLDKDLSQGLIKQLEAELKDAVGRPVPFKIISGPTF